MEDKYTMYQVIKRDGKIAEFDITKISAAITLAFESQNKQYHPSVIDFLALKVTADFEPKIKDGKIGSGRVCRCCQSLHSLPETERKTP